MSRLAAILVALTTILLSGAVAGFWTGRWGSSQALREATARLDLVPVTVGDWDSQPMELDPRELALTDAEGYLQRRYIHRDTGVAVTVLILCGRPGPVCIHTPDVCYAGAGYRQTGPAKLCEISPGSAQFQVLDFTKVNVAAPTTLRIFLSWGYDKQWKVPTNPRMTFAAYPYLYKLYAVREAAKPGEPLEQDPAEELLQQLMPQLQEVLFGGKKST